MSSLHTPTEAAPGSGRSFAKNDPVIVRPKMFPREAWNGTILRKTPNGFSVAYTAFGVTNRQTFSPAEIELVDGRTREIA